VKHLRANGFGEEDIGAIEAALDAVLVNAIQDGNRNDPARKVRIDYGTADDILHVLVSDEGERFDSSRVPDPTRPENMDRPVGRGLLLVRHYMSGVLILGKGSDLLMWKRRSRNGQVARTPPEDGTAKHPDNRGSNVALEGPREEETQGHEAKRRNTLLDA
jgi:serine/threonine-protein kinase RsbW